MPNSPDCHNTADHNFFAANLDTPCAHHVGGRVQRKTQMIVTRTRRIAAPLAALALLGACGSPQRPTLGASTSTTLTVPRTAPLPVAPPSAAERAATNKYLVGPGAPILLFERRTAGLLSDDGDAVTVCLRHSPLLPKPKDHDELLRLIGGVPDATLKQRLFDDVGARLLMLQCGNQPIERLKPVNVEQFRSAVRARGAAVSARLDQFGISITG